MFLFNKFNWLVSFSSGLLSPYTRAICRWNEFNLEVCFFDFIHSTTAGISNDPTRAVTTTVNKEAQYCAGTGGGSALKYAVKLPNLAAGSFENASRSAANGESVGVDALIVLVELPANVSTQLANS